MCTLSCRLPNSHTRTWSRVGGTWIVHVVLCPKPRNPFTTAWFPLPRRYLNSRRSRKKTIILPPAIVKKIGSAKGKGKGKRVASSQVSTRSYTKASVQRTAAPATTVVGSPSAIPQDLVPAPSHSGFTVPSVPRKRKAIAPDTSASSLEKSSSHVLIENVDMGELIEDLMRTKVHPPAYRRIQEFLTKVSLTFICFFIQSIYFIIFF